MATYITPLKAYKNGKVSLLRDFGIYLTEEQRKHLFSLESEITVDNFCRKLITDKLDRPSTPIKCRRKERKVS